MSDYRARAKRFYDSKRWKSCRAYYIDKRIMIDGGMCEHCGKSLGYIVDHIEELNDSNIANPSIALSHDNLQYLCVVCHNVKTFTKGTAHRVTFDDEGNVNILPSKK